MRTLLVDTTARPVMLVPVETAISHLAQATMEGDAGYQTLIEHDTMTFRSQHLEIAAPVVLMTPSFVELRSKDTVRVSRRVLFARDNYACQYCDYVAEAGRTQKSLTVDHVKPARLFPNREAATTWDNVVTACRHCNQAKGGKLPMDCGMMPRCTPKMPHYVQLRFAGRLNAAQQNYVRDYFGDSDLVL